MSKNVSAVIGHDGLTRRVEYTIPDNEPEFWGADKVLSIVGKQRLARPDAVDKVTGRAKYTHDIHRPNMLHAAMVTCPYGSARINSVDTSDAEAMPGVKAVILSSSYRNATYAGALIAAVAAETIQQARDAAAKVKVDYQPGTFRINALPEAEEEVPEEGTAEAKAPREGRIELAPTPNRGEVESGLLQADVIHEAVYETPVTPHCCLETHGCVAEWNGSELTVWYSTQGVWMARRETAAAARIPESQVRVITQHVGGAFGSKLQTEAFGHLCVQLARQTQRPVKFMANRYEDMVQCGNKPGAVMNVRIGARTDGTLTSITATNRVIGGGTDFRGPFQENYECANVRVTESSVTLSSGPSRAFRAPGYPQGTFGIEMAMEELAAALAMDPLEFRLKNIAVSEMDARKHCLEVGAERFGWKQKYQPHGSQTTPIRRGVGVATVFWPYYAGARGAQARCTIFPDGSVEVANACQDLGTGIRTAMLAVAAETLGVPASRIQITIGDTRMGLLAPMSGGSVTTANVAPAVHSAAYRAQKRLFDLVAPAWQTAAGNLACRDGVVFNTADESQRMPWAQACALITGDPILVTAEDAVRPSIRGVSLGGGMRGAHFAEVEVNTETGKVHCRKIVAVHECGRAMAKAQAESQICGGANMGVSYALFENRILEPFAGRQINPNFEDYKILGPMDAPDIEPVLVDLYDPVNNCSAKGLGEPPHVPTAAAIGCAVFNALGVPVRSLPITPYKVLAALAAGGRVGL